MAKSFKHININGSYEKCPTCGALVRQASINSTHVNGEQFESVTFECGCVAKYIPNFSRVEIRYECPKAKTTTILEEQLEDCRQRLIAIINRTKLPKPFKMTFIDEVKGFNRNHWALFKYRDEKD